MIHFNYLELGGLFARFIHFCALRPLPRTWPKQSVFFAVDTDIFDDGNETTVDILRFANTRTENPQKFNGGNASRRNSGMNLCGRWEGYVSNRSRCRHASLACEKSQHTRSTKEIKVDLPRAPSGLLARLPEKLWLPATGLAARDPCGVPPREPPEGGFSFNFLDLPFSLISAPDPTASTSLPDPEAPIGMLRTRFLPA